MGTQIQASKRQTVSGKVQNQGGKPLERTRIKAIYVVSENPEGSLTFKNGNGNGPIVMVLDTPEGAQNIDFQGDGLLFPDGVYVTMTDVKSLVVFY